MIDERRLFRTTIAIASLSAPNYRRELAEIVVDTGSEYNWMPAGLLLELGIRPARIERFETANGRVVEREVGFALIYASGRSTATPVVFAGDDDIVMLGAIALDGLNLRVDGGRRELVPAGPVPVASHGRPALV
jgi:predicted aspartyl protease